MVFIAGLLFAISGKAATVYMWRDSSGVKQYTDYCPQDQKCVAKRVGQSGGTHSDGDGGGGKSNNGKSWKHATTTSTDTSDTGTSTSDTGTTSTTDGDTTTDTTADSGIDATVPDTNTDSEPTTTGDASDSTPPDDTSPTETDTVTNGSAVLTWDPVADYTLSGYHLFYAKADGAYDLVDIGNTTSYSMTGLEGGTRFYFRVAAYDSYGNQSAFSNEVYKDMP
jgi:hypothetical protein